MLIEPSERLWLRLYDKYYPGGTPNFKDVFDMDLLNIEFKVGAGRGNGWGRGGEEGAGEGEGRA